MTTIHDFDIFTDSTVTVHKVRNVNKYHLRVEGERRTDRPLSFDSVESLKSFPTLSLAPNPFVSLNFLIFGRPVIIYLKIKCQNFCKVCEESYSYHYHYSL